MIEETLKKIEDTVRSAPKANAETKEKLLEQLGELRAELETLERTHGEHARSIATLTEAAATVTESHAEARAGLADSVRQFEATHPQLGNLVRAICDSLAAMGI